MTFKLSTGVKVNKLDLRKNFGSLEVKTEEKKKFTSNAYTGALCPLLP